MSVCTYIEEGTSLCSVPFLPVNLFSGTLLSSANTFEVFQRAKR